MGTTQWIAIASIATVIVSAVAILAGLRGVRDQLRTTVFLEYTKRYAKIMHNMPYEAREPGSGYQLASRSAKERYHVLAVFREYLNMCSEENWLHECRRIDHPTWDIWKCGMEDVAHFPCFREAWDILAREYDAYKAFQEFVTDVLLPYAPPGKNPDEAGSPDAQISS